MKVCVIGAGAIGGLIAARIAGAARIAKGQSSPDMSVSLSVLARGATLATLRNDGLTVHDPVANRAGTFTTDVEAVDATDSAADAGPQDLVIIAVKYHALATLAAQLTPLLGPDTIILSAMNGVPWWFTKGLKTGGVALSLPAVDPDAVISTALDPNRVIGCVVHLAASTRAPGVIERTMGNRLVIGEPLGHRTERLARVAGLLAWAGFDVEVSDNIHAVAWYKLWGNLSMNPVSAITGAKTDAILADPLARGFLSELMREAARVGARIGLAIDEPPESRHAITASLGGFKTSMLQDVEAGRSLEIDALVTVVHQMARQLGEPVPFIDALLGLTRVFARSRGLY